MIQLHTGLLKVHGIQLNVLIAVQRSKMYQNVLLYCLFKSTRNLRNLTLSATL